MDSPVRPERAWRRGVRRPVPRAWRCRRRAALRSRCTGTASRCYCICVLHIDRLALRLIRLPLVAFFETSFGRVYDRTFVLVTLGSDGIEGLGECVADADPYYSGETTVTAWYIIKDFIAPRVLGRSFAHPRDVAPAL